MEMRLLYVIDSLAPGGAETSLADMAPGLVARGVDLHVLSLGPRLDLADRLVSAGAEVHASDGTASRGHNIRIVHGLARAIRPDLIHTTLYEADVAGRTAAAALRVPASTSIVNDSYGASHYAESNTLKLHAARALDSLTSALARRFHAISTSIADTVAPRLGIAPSKIDVIPRGRDPLAFPFRPGLVREEVRASMGIGPVTPVVLSVGRLEPQKGHRNLLAALPALSRDYPDIVVLLAGKEGRASASLRRMAGQQRIDVRFLGHREDVAALLAAADVFCFPSEREGLGGVLIEALATGCPIVASSIPTSVEVLQARGEPVGLLSPPGDAADLARSLTSVLSDPAASHARAQRGRAHYEANFTTNVIDERMNSFFRSAAD